MILPSHRGLGIRTCICLCVEEEMGLLLLEEGGEWRRDRARAGGGTRAVAIGGGANWRRSGGCPGLDFLRMGTLVVRMTGSSALVDVVGDGGGFGVVMVVAGCSAGGLWDVARLVRLRCVGGGIGGVLGGGVVYMLLLLKCPQDLDLSRERDLSRGVLWMPERWRAGAGELGGVVAKKSVVLSGKVTVGSTRQ